MKLDGVAGVIGFGSPMGITTRRAKITSLIALGLLIGALFLPLQAMTIRLPRQNDKLVDAAMAGTGARLEMVYRHSVEKTLVKGIFEVDKAGRLTALETRMESTGTGMPNTESKRTRREAGWIVVDEGRQVIGRFPFFFQPINQLEMSLGEERLNLTTLKAGDVLNIGVERLKLWEWLGYKLLDRAWPPPDDEN